MVRRLGLALAVVLVGLVAIFVVGMRLKWPPVLDVVRQMAHRFFNPSQMRTAGTPGAYASIIHHVGRVSGRAYETPVSAVPAGDDGFVVALPYGTRADWVRNVLAAGSATLVTEGETVEIDRPEVVASVEAAEYFSPSDRRSMSLFGIDECIVLRR